MLRTVGNSCQLRIEKCKFLNVYVEDLVLLRKQTKKRNKNMKPRGQDKFFTYHVLQKVLETWMQPVNRSTLRTVSWFSCVRLNRSNFTDLSAISYALEGMTPSINIIAPLSQKYSCKGKWEVKVGLKLFQLVPRKFHV